MAPVNLGMAIVLIQEKFLSIHIPTGIHSNDGVEDQHVSPAITFIPVSEV